MTEMSALSPTEESTTPPASGSLGGHVTRSSQVTLVFPQALTMNAIKPNAAPTEQHLTKQCMDSLR
jgi:hypothetical protein